MAKEFLILGNTNAITYKEVLPHIKDGKLWLGPDSHRQVLFSLPDDCEKYAVIDGNGAKYAKVPAISWYTNMPSGTSAEPLALTKRYDPDKYKKYDNYDAIEVPKVRDIPIDYYGVMGVPITFLAHWHPGQFAIVGFRYGDDGKDLCINGKCPYFRILIKRNDADK